MKAIIRVYPSWFLDPGSRLPPEDGGRIKEEKTTQRFWTCFLSFTKS